MHIWKFIALYDFDIHMYIICAIDEKNIYIKVYLWTKNDLSLHCEYKRD